MKTTTILGLLLSSIFIYACSSGSSGNSSATPAQQFATNIINKSMQIANTEQTLQLAAFSNANTQAYLFTRQYNNNTSYLYSFNGNSWLQNNLDTPNMFIPLSMSISSSGIYFAGYDNIDGIERAALYLYAQNNWQRIESNPYLQHCNNYCYIKALATANDSNTIYTSGVDDNGIEIYKYDGSWTALPTAPLATESAFIAPSGDYVYLLEVNALTVDTNNNLYLGAAFGAYKGPYEGYLAKFNNGVWQQESLPAQFSWSVNGLTFANNQVYASGINNAYYGAPVTSYTISSLNNTQWTQLYNYTISESSLYSSPIGIYSDAYGNVYSLMEQNGLGNVMTLSIPAP